MTTLHERIYVCDPVERPNLEALNLTLADESSTIDSMNSTQVSDYNSTFVMPPWDVVAAHYGVQVATDLGLVENCTLYHKPQIGFNDLRQNTYYVSVS